MGQPSHKARYLFALSWPTYETYGLLDKKT